MRIVTMQKREVPRYECHENRNKKYNFLPIENEKVFWKILDTRYLALQNLVLIKFIITFREFCNEISINYRIRFVTEYITYLNICEVLSRTFSSLLTHGWMVMGWQWGQGHWKRSSYIQVSDVLCHKLIHITLFLVHCNFYFHILSILNVVNSVL